jgi:acetate kinase
VRVLVLNAGSVTLKGTVLDVPGREPLLDRTIDWSSESGVDRAAGVAAMLDGLAEAGIMAASIDAVGHRVVHGGERFTEPVAVDDRVVESLETLDDLAPLHNPPAIETMRAALRALPDPVHVAAFDTAFHSTLPESARRYPVPDRWLEEWGVRRYGFHGLSVAWSVERAGELLRRSPQELRLIVAHLGGGASVTAVDGGRSVDTSMGLTPLEGLMMATRSGSIDPGAILRVLRAGRPLDAVADDLERRSGLLGVSGHSSDMRELLRAEGEGDQRASLAIEMFVRHAAGGVAAAATSLPRLDGLIFTGGIGEHAAAVRARILERLAILGPPSVAGPERDGDGVLAAGPPAVLRVHAREDVVIANAAASLAGDRA